MGKFGMTMVLGLVLFLVGCGTAPTLKTAIEKKGIKYEQVLYSEKLSNGAVVFYETPPKDNTLGLGILLLEYRNKSWKLVASEWSSYPKKEQMGWDFFRTASGIDKKPFWIFYGIIENPLIEKIDIKIADESYLHAKVIQTQRNPLWFIELDSNVKPLAVVGYSKDNEQLYLVPLNN
ncbi:MAG: hypothetical protein WA131_12425 [Desulfitobacteriaceae bacterium]